MGKYQPLARYLENLPRDSWEASFEEIEEILGFNLPRSAHDQSAWWANAINSSQAKGWLPAGWWAEGANLTKGRVFLKRQSGNMTSTEIQKLWENARKVSGIEDPQELERAAVSCFIHREAGRQLAEMGGTMPDFKAPPRRRITW